MANFIHHLSHHMDPSELCCNSLLQGRSDTPELRENSWPLCLPVRGYAMYLCRRNFITASDHKPIEMIHLKNLAAAPPHLQGMLLKLQWYDLTIRQRPSKEMLLTDGLSRYLSHDSIEHLTKIKNTVYSVVFTAERSHTRRPILRTVLQVIETGWPASRNSLPQIARRY